MTSLPCRKNPNNKQRYSVLKEKEHNSPHFTCGCAKCGLLLGVQHEQSRRLTLPWGNLTDIALSRWPRSGSSMLSHLIACTFDLIWWQWCFISVIFSSKAHDPSVIMKIRDKSQQGHILQNTWTILLKIVRVIQNKENLRICQSRGA